MGILVVFSVATTSAVYVVRIINQLPPLEDFGSRKISQSTKIYDRTGEVLLYEVFGEEKRTILLFEEIPEKVKLATLAVEDAGFYDQPAFDIKGILRAFVANIKERRVVQGGSTITQQLVKSVFLTPERTLTRKLKELILAVELESKYTKNEILGAYLNQIPYGSNAYGIEAAAQTFFNKSIKELSLAEATALASLTPAPTRFSPWGEDPELIVRRKNNALERMYELGFIDKEEFEEGVSEELVFAPPSLGKIKAPHFSIAVQNKLIEAYGEDFVRTGGLVVITTLDWDLQQIAEEVVLEGALRNEELYEGENAALVAQDPQTGEVLAMVGSRDYFDEKIDGNFNIITQALRQPGSALKPFVYLEALNKGYRPETIVFDTHTEFVSNNPACPAIITPTSRRNSACFNPENFDNKFRGPVTLAEALSQSINVPAVKVLYLAGFDGVLKTLNDFGITTLKERWRYGLSLVLGGGEVRPMELVNAYATLAREGVYVPHSLINKIETGKGDVLEINDKKGVRVFDESPTKQINNVLSDVELRSGLFQTTLGMTTFPNREVALKTGTTNDYRDAWALGYTPSVVVGVWAGNNDNRPMQERGSSLLAAIPIWSSFLHRAFNETELVSQEEAFSRPAHQLELAKPMVGGEFIFSPVVDGEPRPQVHSILYWVEKNNPLEAPPINPGNDPQFENWQKSVLVWAERNIPNFMNEYNKPLPENVFLSEEVDYENFLKEKIKINHINIKNGDFVSTPFDLTISASSDYPATIEVNINNTGVFASSRPEENIFINFRVTTPLESQNSIDVLIENTNGESKRLSLIVYTK